AKFFSNILVYLQVLVMFFIIPLFGVVILGMLWKRATAAGGFWGFLAGILTSVGEFVYVHVFPGSFDPSRLNPDHVRHIALSPLAQDMAVNMYSAFWSLLVCMGVTLAVSLCTAPKSREELKDLVYGLTRLPDEGPTPWYRHPNFWAAVVFCVLVVVNIMFW
ncbi:MAG TPA: Na+/galactose cotransporter, partial [Bacteroidota bacterium]|nr:Na+/galactose cotransporter [Bacteroidota bacterium]